MRDPISHPGEIDLSILDAIQAVDSARRVVQIFDTKTASQIQNICKLLMTLERGDSDPSRLLEDNLPAPESIVADFIGRIEQLEELYSWFNDLVQKRWLLAGAGGRGKTAIAYRFATQIKYSAPDPYTRVLWISAKRRKFMEGSIVAIDHPDFTDLNSATDKLLIGYGWEDATTEPIANKTDLLLKLLNEEPVLLVVDDLDTLTEEEDEAVSFFTFEVPHSKSKILFTSRNRFPGMNRCTTQVEGFDRKEVEDYLMGLLEKFVIHDAPIDNETIKRIREVTDGSPLYIEELMRLHAMGVPLDECITNWKDNGKEARNFSLRREFESLDVPTQKVLLACCINREPSTIADLEAVTKLTQNEVLKAIEILKRLFLVPRPSVIAGVPRFDVNPNTRLLVIDVMSGYGSFADIQSAFKSLHGEIMASGKRRADIKAYQRQVVADVDAGRPSEAEKFLLEKALVEYPNDPDLLGQLGWVHLHWQPTPRIEDARRSFSRSAKLSCKNSGMYWRWWRMEADRNNWTFAMEACEKGLGNCPSNIELQYCLGYSRSRLGKSLESQFQYPRAQDEFVQASKILEKALESSNQIAPHDNKLRSQIYRALILAYDAQIPYVDPTVEKNKEYTLKSGMLSALNDWGNESVDNEFLRIEKNRLRVKYPDLFAGKQDLSWAT
jgi:tetratricopeptide (TPR) repeat protein